MLMNKHNSLIKTLLDNANGGQKRHFASLQCLFYNKCRCMHISDLATPRSEVSAAVDILIENKGIVNSVLLSMIKLQKQAIS